MVKFFYPFILYLAMSRTIQLQLAWPFSQARTPFFVGRCRTVAVSQISGPGTHMNYIWLEAMSMFLCTLHQCKQPIHIRGYIACHICKLQTFSFRAGHIWEQYRFLNCHLIFLLENTIKVSSYVYGWCYCIYDDHDWPIQGSPKDIVPSADTWQNLPSQSPELRRDKLK